MYISAIIITLNEAAHIGECIESLSGVADEIIVLDAFSTDDTPDICKEKQVRFVQQKWEGYSASKNYANSLASFPYLLSIDADERLTETLRAEIMEIKTRLKGTYKVKRQNFFSGKWIRGGGWYPDSKIRLFPKNASRWEGEIHEKLITIEPVTLLKGDLIHQAYSSREQFLQKTEKYSALAAEELYRKGKKTNPILMIAAPVFRFIKMFFFQCGLLDGGDGFFIAKTTAKGVFKRHILLHRMHSGIKKQKVLTTFF